MHRGQLNCALDWQLFTGMKKPLRTVAKCHTCARQVVLRGGLTQAGFRCLMFVNYSGATERSLSSATRETDKTTTLTTQRKHVRSSLNVSISPPADC